jgi:hypothetical protein
MQNSAEKIVRRFILKLRLAQIVSAAVLLVISFFLFLAISSSLISLVAIMGLCFAMYVLRMIYVYGQLVKLNAIIEIDCDPIIYTSVFQLLITKPIYRSRVTSASLNIAYGLTMQGKHQQADVQLQETNISKKSPSLRVSYYSIFANCAEARGDYDAVAWALSQLQQITAAEKRSSKTVKYSNMAIQIINTMLAEYNKQYDLAIEFLTGYLNTAVYPLQLVSAKYRLARLHFYKEDYMNAKAHCEYVIQHGNKLIHVTRAEELLQMCQGDGSLDTL